MKAQRDDRKATGASLSFRDHRARSLDPPSSCLGLFGRVNPANKISPRNGRKIAPLGLRNWSRREGFAKIRGLGGFHPECFFGAGNNPL